MRARKSCVICGGTAVGKTTLLRAVAADIPAWERLITIEDSSWACQPMRSVSLPSCPEREAIAKSHASTSESPS